MVELDTDKGIALAAVRCLLLLGIVISIDTRGLPSSHYTHTLVIVSLVSVDATPASDSSISSIPRALFLTTPRRSATWDGYHNTQTHAPIYFRHGVLRCQRSSNMTSRSTKTETSASDAGASSTTAAAVATLSLSASSGDPPRDPHVTDAIAVAATTTTTTSASSSSPSTSSSPTSASTKKKIPFNPSAGQVHARERGQPWRIEYETQCAQQNTRAKLEVAEKRRWGLAKQIHEGLVLNYKVNYGVAEFASLLRDASAIRTRREFDSKSEAACKEAREIALLQLLAAAEKYDLKQILALLSKFPKGSAPGPAGGGNGAE